MIVYLWSQKQNLLIHHKCLNYGLCVLLILLENHSTPNLAMIKMSDDYMKRVLNPATDDFPHDPTTTICLVDLLWKGLLTNEENLQCFIKLGSTYTLLDLIEVIKLI